MKNSQLVEIARTLSKKEVREIKKWLASPAHNHRDDVVQLFDYLLQGQHLEVDKFLEKTRVFKKIFPEEPYDDARLRQTMHFLLKTIEEYLISSELLQDETAAQFALARVYRHKGLENTLQKTINSIERRQRKEIIQDDTFFLNQYYLYQEVNEADVRGAARLQEMSQALETSFIIRKLRIACFMVNHQSIYKTEYDYGLLDPLLNYVKENDLLRIQAIAIYYYCYKSLSQPHEEGYFFTYRDIIFEHNDVLPHFEMRNNYLLAINYCATKVNQSKIEFRDEVFKLYRQGIEKKVLFSDEGYLTNSTFRNTVNIGTLIGAFDWIKSFIETYQQFLTEGDREQMVLSSWGKFYFEKGEYDKARDYLIQVNPSNVLLNLNIKSMLIRIYYHEDEFQLLDALLESMKVYINRKKILMPQHRRPFLNLIKYTKKLVRVNPFDKTAVAKLRSEIEAVQPLIAKEWFLEQVDQL